MSMMPNCLHRTHPVHDEGGCCLWPVLQVLFVLAIIGGLLLMRGGRP